MNLKGGVLIIGSLFWQDDQGTDLFQRKNWRSKRLAFKDRIHVFAPIRYGRLSRSDKFQIGTYTMVLSKDAELRNELGTAYVIPMKKFTIKSLKGIQNQAKFLSIAENIQDDKLIKGKDKWGIIGIVFNPKIDEPQKTKILNYWKGKLVKDGGFDPNEYCISPEKPIMGSNGEILISWIKTIDDNMQKEMDQFDFLLATCTKPTKYASIEGLQENIRNDKRKYLYNNIKNGITTFIDRKVIESERK